MTNVRPDYFIMQRRAKEEKLANMQNALKAEASMKHNSLWEAKTSNMIISNNMQRRFNEKKAEFEEQLMVRRMKLAQLLQAEAKMYQEEYEAKQETPEQVRQKMAQRVQELKEKFENERQNQVKYLMEKRWKESADELRLQEQKFQELECMEERKIQIQNKEVKGLIQKQEDMLFDELMKRDAAQKEQMLKERELKQKQREQERMEKLNLQFEDRQRMKENLQQSEEQEKQMLKQAYQSDRIREEEQMRQRKDFFRQQNLEIIQHNEIEQRLREEQEMLGKEKDKQMIKDILEWERTCDEHERNNRMKRREEAQKLQQILMQARAQEADIEKQQELQAKKDADKQWALLEAKYRAEENARIKLMQEVYDSRYQAIMEKQRLAEREKLKDLEEKERVAREIYEAQIQDQLKRQVTKETKKEHQDVLKFQMGEKQYSKQKKKQQDIYEAKAAQLAEIEYKRKILQEKHAAEERLRNRFY